MPTYEYQCNSCGNHLEVVQSFSDPSLTVCPACGEEALRKVFGNVGVVFKGSGFYRNDSREEAKQGSSSASKDKGANSSESGSGEKKDSAKDTKAAPAAAEKKSDKSESKAKPKADKPATK